MKRLSTTALFAITLATVSAHLPADTVANQTLDEETVF